MKLNLQLFNTSILVIWILLGIPTHNYAKNTLKASAANAIENNTKSTKTGINISLKSNRIKNHNDRYSGYKVFPTCSKFPEETAMKFTRSTNVMRMPPAGNCILQTQTFPTSGGQGAIQNAGWNVSGSYTSGTAWASGDYVGTSPQGIEFIRDAFTVSRISRSFSVPAGLILDLNNIAWRNVDNNISASTAVLSIKLNGVTYATITTAASAGSPSANEPYIQPLNGASVNSNNLNTGLVGQGISPASTKQLSFNNTTAGTFQLEFEFSAGSSTGGVDDIFIGVITLSTNAPNTPTQASKTNPVCGTNTGSVTLNTQNGVFYNVDGGTFQSSPTFSGLAPGNHTFRTRKLNAITCPSAPLTVNIGPVIATNTAAAPSATPTVCINTGLTAITHATTGATGIGTATGLPAGVSASWAANTITISGTPSVNGNFNYSIPLTGGCGTVNATGTITVTPSNTVTAASSAPVICEDSPLTAITHTTTGASGIGTATGLPAGVSASWAANTITVSGVPTETGIFNYSIPLTGGCETLNATGTITVEDCCPAGNSAPTVTDNSISNACPMANINLNDLINVASPNGSQVVWFTNNTQTGNAYASPTAAQPGTYYTYFYNQVNDCYSPASSVITANVINCCAVQSAPVFDNN